MNTNSTHNTTSNLRVTELRPLMAPDLLLAELPISHKATQTVTNARDNAANIIAGKDDRLLVIVGPCSIHDPKAAMEYAEKLQALSVTLETELQIIMRVYFEKPRTTVGWKGLINDPELNNSFNINKGLKTARELLLNINNLGLAAGTEFLDTIIPQYLSDLVSWAAIGARTSESQIHRELVSGLSMPVGFKNGTGGSVKIAIDAISAAKQPHHFLGVTLTGNAAIVSTVGNPNCHVILRGSTIGPNYDSECVNNVAQMLGSKNIDSKVMVDCSHGNSNKDYKRQAIVIDELCSQMASGSKNICGVMIESNLLAGNQKLVKGQVPQYGQSITDACVDWAETETLLKALADAVKQRRELAKQ